MPAAPISASRSRTALLLAVAVITGAGCPGDDASEPPAAGPAAPVPTRLAFEVQPGDVRTFADFSQPVRVRVEDANGTLVSTSTATISLELANSDGQLLLHASGDSSGEPDPSRVLELVDPNGPGPLHWLPMHWRENEVFSLAYDERLDRFLLTNLAENDFYAGDPRTGEVTLIGDGTLDDVKGMAFMVDPPLPNAGLLIAVVARLSSRDPGDLFVINPSNGALNTGQPRRFDSGTAVAMNGLTVDRTTGTIYAAATLSGAGLSGRGLVRIDTLFNSATLIGDLGDKVAGLASGSDGTLFAVTGDGASTPSALYRVDKSDAHMTLVTPLGAGGDGEAIAAIPGRLTGPLTAQAVDGIASFPGVQLEAVGATNRLSASSPGLSDATSDSFRTLSPSPGGTLGLDATSQTVSETEGTVTVGIVIDTAQPHDIIATLSVGGTAADATAPQPDTDLDYRNYLQIRLPAGDMRASVSFSVIDDAEPESVAETVVVQLEDASLAGALGVQTQTITITSDE